MTYAVLQAAAGFGADPACVPPLVFDPVLNVCRLDLACVTIGGARVCRTDDMRNVDPTAVQAMLVALGLLPVRAASGAGYGPITDPEIITALAKLVNTYGIPVSGSPDPTMNTVWSPQVTDMLVRAYLAKSATAGLFGGHVVPGTPGGGGSSLVESTPPPVFQPAPAAAPGFWDGLSTFEKVALVGGGAALAALLLYAAKKAFKPNRGTGRARSWRRFAHRMITGAEHPVSRPWRRGGKRKYVSNARRGRAYKRWPSGNLLLAKTRIVRYKGRRIGRARAPKKYRKLGAVRASQYAWPQGYMYPIHDAKHTRAASARFAKWKRRYPKYMQRVIAKRIDTAKQRFHIGEYRTR